MAKIFKPTVTAYWLRNCWLDPEGNPCHKDTPGATFIKARRVPKGTPGAVKQTRKSSKYYGRVDGKPVPLSTNGTAAQTMLSDLLKEIEWGKAGLAPFAEQRKRPLAEHVADYRKHLAAKGNCPEHIAKTCTRIEAVFAGCGFAFIGNIDAGHVETFLHGLRANPHKPALPPGQEKFTKRQLVEALGGIKPAALARVLRRESLPAAGNGKARRYPRVTVEALQDRFCRGIGVNTSNGYLAALKGFTRWLNTAKPQRWPTDPLAGLKLLNADVDVRHERRAHDENELRTILTAAAANPVGFEGLAGPDRAMLYAVAMTTGLRASEIASLVPASFDLDGTHNTVTVKAGYSKNRKEAEQPLPPDVADALRGYLAGKPTAKPVWPGPWPAKAAEMLRGDLNAAGIAYRDSEGRVGDFHSLRHSYITLLSQSGVTPRMAQELARHSDIKLTMNTYTHIGLHDAAAAVDSMPRLLPTAGEGQTLRATGTDGKAADKGQKEPVSVCRRFAYSNDKPCQSMVGHGTNPSSATAGSHNKKSPEIIGNSSNQGDMVRHGLKLPGQDSNLDKESQNLLCYRYTTG